MMMMMMIRRRRTMTMTPLVVGGGAGGVGGGAAADDYITTYVQQMHTKCRPRMSSTELARCTIDYPQTKHTDDNRSKQLDILQ